MTVQQPLPAAPEGLKGAAATAWTAIVRTIAQARPLREADLLSIEAAAKAWARWRMLEDKLGEMSAGNPLAAEVTRTTDGKVTVSPLREAANGAFEAYRDLAQSLGLDERVDLASIDLFGYPDRPGRGQKGRPRFTVTQKDRNRVRLLLAMGWSNKRIAAALEVSLPTLHRYFDKVLEERELMRDRLDARRLELAMEQASAGNITALRELGRLIERQDQRLAQERLEAIEDEPDEKLGKKELQRRRAEEIAAEADGDWGDDLKPGYH